MSLPVESGADSGRAIYGLGLMPSRCRLAPTPSNRLVNGRGQLCRNFHILIDTAVKISKQYFRRWSSERPAVSQPSMETSSRRHLSKALRYIVRYGNSRFGFICMNQNVCLKFLNQNGRQFTPHYVSDGTF